MAAIGLFGVLVSCFGKAGFGLAQQRSGESYPGERREIVGTLGIDPNGCFRVVVDGTPYFVIWPAGAGDGGDHVNLGLFEHVREGDTVIAVGALTPVAPLVADQHGYWASYISYCAPEADAVLVFDEVRRAE